MFTRDRYVCQSCGKNQAQAKLTVDHITALYRGGADDFSNLQTPYIKSNCSE